MTLPIEASRPASIVHPCLEPAPRGVPLRQARLTDRRKVGVLLQAAGLLSLLERAGWGLVGGWHAARVAPDGRLAVGEDGVAPGRSSRPPQELLVGLTAQLFGDGPVAGRGEARRVVRVLLDSWHQTLVPLPPDEAVLRILETASFLWEAEHAGDRCALAGALERRGGGLRLWVAGPRRLRQRLLARCRSAVEIRDLLAGPDAHALWEGEEDGPATELAAAGHWQAAVAAWDRRPPATEEERVSLAATQAALGRFHPALESLAGLSSPAARALAARCQLDCGQLGAARATLRRLENATLPPSRIAELAEIASRVHSQISRPRGADFWVQRALAESAGDPEAALLARMAAAGAAWDRDDLAAMDGFLEQARPALDEPSLAWRWHHARALRAMKEEDGGRDVVVNAAHALRLGRRRLTRRQAAGLWNDLGFGRARIGDLRGAERAFIHALRLESGCDGPRKTTLVLFNLAEIRLRQGRLAGIRDILARAEEEDRRAGNRRGLVYATALWARFELALGRPSAALALCQEALTELERQRLNEHRGELHLLAARALGWLARPTEAARELTFVPREALRELEPEEHPALKALAGDREGALEAAAGGPLSPLWQRLLAGQPPPVRDWEPVDDLEPYRAARLVFDAELILPGSAPGPWLRKAIEVFRQIGAGGLADRLEARDGGSWALVGLILQQALAREPPAEEPPSPTPGRSPAELVGESPKLLAALDRIGRLAAGELPVLILGESGTGKELAARRLHRLSGRAARAFVAVNCAALSETLLLSDLFGHTRGAFTGADRDRKGVFETAHGGTVFLDEIGDLPLSAQGMLLRVLQEGEIRRLGESAARRVDVRVLAATHHDLPGDVEEGSFRRDLYYRLRVGCIELPPLRERGDDVLRIADGFLARLRRTPAARLSRQARACLLAHRWPGNVRELENVLAVGAALAVGSLIGPEHLELPSVGSAPEAAYHQQVDALRRQLVRRALADCNGNRTEAARRLGISRQALSYLVKQLALDPVRGPQGAGLR